VAKAKSASALQKNTGSGNADGPLSVKRRLEAAVGQIWSPLRKKWLLETPEEAVRQEYLCVLVNEYGFSLDHIGEEVIVTHLGSGKARADFLIWRTAEDKQNKLKPLIVVECKADYVTIDQATYYQGGNYAQYVQSPFFVTHNNRETRFWKVDHAKMAPNFDEIENIPHADASDKEVEELVNRLKVFKEDEFASLLQRCHDVIRNAEAHDPTKAFDETAKILFVKVFVERDLKIKKRRVNVFSADFLDQQIGDDPLNDLFQKTKQHYKHDELFAVDDRIQLKPETGKEIVRLLERYNLSDTSEDVKGIAFEKFLGRTFRGEIGQFFTPRPIVEFIIRMIDPKENETICDPAAGSGGFLIRFFEIVREKILRDANERYKKVEAAIAADKKKGDAQKAAALLEEHAKMQKSIDPAVKGSRLWTLANRCVYGTDKNDRMARTSKMNMIMHGDGHGGVHHWDGFLNVNGIFEDRFDVVLTNPPFGSKLSFDSAVMRKDVAISDEQRASYETAYGDDYRNARARLEANIGKPIAGMFELPALTKGSSSIKTEVLFLERCINLLRPGGRLGIVLPEGIFNNSSMESVRDVVESRGRIQAVVSIPVDAFVASGATVKTSLLFLQKFTKVESENWQRLAKKALGDEQARRKSDLNAQDVVAKKPAPTAADFPAVGKSKAAQAAAATALAEAKEAHKSSVAAAKKRMKEISFEIIAQARLDARKLARYPIFFYDAQKVGITSTGESDENELYPNPRTPAGAVTALERFETFKKDHDDFFRRKWACSIELPAEQTGAGGVVKAKATNTSKLKVDGKMKAKP
jgi:type I restriction enzyme M protein